MEYDKGRYLTDEESLKVQLRLKAEGKIDKVGFPAFEVQAVPRKKKPFKPYYHRQDYKSNYYRYMKKRAGL
jgi:hypothetical protein